MRPGLQNAAPQFVTIIPRPPGKITLPFLPGLLPMRETSSTVGREGLYCQ